MRWWEWAILGVSAGVLVFFAATFLQFGSDQRLGTEVLTESPTGRPASVEPLPEARPTPSPEPAADDGFADEDAQEGTIEQAVEQFVEDWKSGEVDDGILATLTEAGIGPPTSTDSVQLLECSTVRIDFLQWVCNVELPDGTPLDFVISDRDDSLTRDGGVQEWRVVHVQPPSEPTRLCDHFDMPCPDEDGTGEMDFADDTLVGVLEPNSKTADRLFAQAHVGATLIVDLALGPGVEVQRDSPVLVVPGGYGSEDPFCTDEPRSCMVEYHLPEGIDLTDGLEGAFEVTSFSGPHQGAFVIRFERSSG